MPVKEKDPIGPSNVRASAVTAPSTTANSDLARPGNVAFGSNSDVAIDSEWVAAAATLSKPTFIFKALQTRNRVPQICVIVRKRRTRRAS
jgi:hypothetical protein